jgi:hypothetical protein
MMGFAGAFRRTFRPAGPLGTGSWLTRERVRLITFGLIIASLAGLGWLIATADGLNDRLNRPLGTDFSNVYAAGTYVLDGQPAKPFDPPAQYAREQALFGAATPFYGWHYPPFFLLIAALLASLPYLPALAIWQGVTLALYLLTIRAIIARPPARPRESADARNTSGDGRATTFQWLLLALAFPAVFINIGHGHNGFLTASLFGGALLLLDRRPLIAGVLIGCLAYKPQFGLLIPLVLAASGRGRVFAAAAVTVALLALVVTAAFGPDVWTAFLASGEFTRKVVLEAGDTGWHKIQSVFAVARMWGAPVPVAYAAQGLMTVAVGIALIRLWRSRVAFTDKAAALMIGTLLATPYSLDYDLMLLAPAIAFLAAGGIARGFAPYEKTLLTLLWIAPLVARTIAQATLIPLAVPAMIAAFIFVLHRAMRSSGIPQLQIHPV